VSDEKIESQEIFLCKKLKLSSPKLRGNQIVAQSVSQIHEEATNIKAMSLQARHIQGDKCIAAKEPGIMKDK